MPVLLIHRPDGNRATVELGHKPLRLGRAETCDIVLRDDSEVSREHVEVWLDDAGRVNVADLRSKNGTRVDDGELFRDASRIALRSIHVGDHRIEIVPRANAAAGPPRSAVRFAADVPSTGGTTQYFPSSRRLDLSQQRLTLLMNLNERISGTFERKQLLEQALDGICEALNFERGLIALRTQRGDETETPVTRNVQCDENGAYKISSTLINRALIHGERAIVNNPATDLVGNLSESLVRFPIQSALCVPILNRDEILGVIYGDRITQASTYKPEDVDFLAAIARQVGLGLANLRLFQEFARSQRMYAELQQARTIQRQLLPDGPLQIGSITAEGCNEPSSAVGGDYFDYFPLPHERMGFIIADVVGHGLPAALIMANLQAAVHVALSAEVSLTDLTTRVNRLVCRNTAPHVFITALLGTLDVHSGHLQYVSAGHPGPILLGDRRPPAADEQNSLPLGIEPQETYVVREIERDQHAGAVLFFTDGLIEASDRQGRLLGVEPVVESLRSLRDPNPAALLKAVRGVLRRHADGVPLTDDMTLLAIGFDRGSASPKPQ